MITTGSNYITKFGVRIFFTDAKNREQKAKATCDIWFEGKFMGIIAKKLAVKLTGGKFKRNYEALGIPEMTEQNLHQIYDLAKQYKVPYWYFMNIEDPSERGYDAIRRLFLLEMIETLPNSFSSNKR